jgi:alkylhydroperoxidase family enzyme
VTSDPESAPLPPRARALVRHALLLTRTPQRVTAADLIPLRDAGFGDPGMNDAASVTSYFNFVNRIAAGLGVEREREP